MMLRKCVLLASQVKLNELLWICSIIYSLPGRSAFTDVILLEQHKQG